MPDDLRAKLEGVAEKNKRSLNAEIIAMLERAIAGQTDQADAGLADRVAELEQRLAELGQHVDGLRADLEELRRR